MTISFLFLCFSISRSDDQCQIACFRFPRCKNARRCVNSESVKTHTRRKAIPYSVFEGREKLKTQLWRDASSLLIVFCLRRPVLLAAFFKCRLAKNARRYCISLLTFVVFSRSCTTLEPQAHFRRWRLLVTTTTATSLQKRCFVLCFTLQLAMSTFCLRFMVLQSRFWLF